jgi:hypothetical protein
MPRRTLLSATDRTSLLAVPSAADERLRHFTLSEPDLSVIRQRRGPHNRLGFAVQLCAPRYPRILLAQALLERLQAVQVLALPEGLATTVHQNRWMKLAREGGQMTGQHLRDLGTRRRHATLAATLLDTRATPIDETIELHEKMLGSLFSRARRRHREDFQQAGRAINDKVRLYSQIGRAPVEARQQGGDPFAAIETVHPWERFRESIEEAEKLARPEDFDYLPRIGDGYAQLRRYAPELLSTLEFRAAPVARDLLAAVELLREMNERQARKVPADAPESFVRQRWKDVVFIEEGIDRRFCEL